MNEYPNIDIKDITALGHSAYTIRRDGDAWLATRWDFVGLGAGGLASGHLGPQQSLSGFGPTPLDALARLILAEKVMVEDGNGQCRA